MPLWAHAERETLTKKCGCLFYLTSNKTGNKTGNILTNKPTPQSVVENLHSNAERRRKYAKSAAMIFAALSGMEARIYSFAEASPLVVLLPVELPVGLLPVGLLPVSPLPLPRR